MIILLIFFPVDVLVPYDNTENFVINSQRQQNYKQQYMWLKRLRPGFLIHTESTQCVPFSVKCIHLLFLGLYCFLLIDSQGFLIS